MENTLRFDREPFDCARFLYYTNRSILLDIFRLIMHYATDESLHLDARSALQDFLGKIVTDDGEVFATKCLSLMSKIRDQSASMEIADRRDKLLGASSTQADQARLSAALVDQHESASIILGLFCRLRPDASQYLVEVVQSLKQVESWTIFVSHLMLIVILSVQALALTEESQVAVLPCNLEQLAKMFRSLIQTIGVRLTDHWRCPPICAILQITLATELNGICKEHDEFASSFDYEQEILYMAQHAVDQDVFQHLITHGLFVQQEVSTTHAFSVFFTKDAFAHYRTSNQISDTHSVTVLLLESYRTFVQNFIMNLADVLKEIHLKTEDSFAVQELSENSDTQDQYHQEDMFYGVVFTAFNDGLDLARAFWEDSESDLYGFLAWASHATVPSTIYAYFKMMSALSKGPTCSVAARTFFEQADTRGMPMSRSLPSPTISWTFIFDSLHYYIRHLDRKQGLTNYNDPLEIDSHNALVLESYLESIHSVISTLPDITAMDAIVSKYDANTILFQLMTCRLPPELYAALLRLLTTFTRSPAQRKPLWSLLDGWLASFALETQSTVISATLRRKAQEIRPLNTLAMFSSLSSEVAICLINFLTALIHPGNLCAGEAPVPQSLGESSRYHGISDYVDFVFTTFTAAQSENNYTTLQRLGISLACVNFSREALESLDLDLIHLVRSGMVSSKAMSSVSNLPQYLKSHPGVKVLSLLNQAGSKDPFLAVIRNHDAADHAIKARLIPIVSGSITTIQLAFERADLYCEFVAPLLKADSANTINFARQIYNDVELFLHLCLLGGGENESCSHASIRLLVQLGRGLDVGNSSLYLAALNSVDESRSILLGFINLLERRDVQSIVKAEMYLRFIVHNLELTSTESVVTVAHFLLGFLTPTTETLSIGADPGEIGSGHSMLHSLLDILRLEEASVLVLEASTAFLQVRATISRIVRLLCEKETTRSIVVPIFREYDLFRESLSHYSNIATVTIDRSIEGDISSRMDRTLEALVLQRTNIFRYCAMELLTCKFEGSFSLLKEYAAFLVASESHLDRFHVLILDYLDVLQLDFSWSLPRDPTKYFDPAPFSSMLRNASPEIINQVQLAIDLSFASSLSSTDDAIRNASAKEYTILQTDLSNALEKIELRKVLLLYLREWTTMSAVMYEVLEKCQRHGRSLVYHEISQHLLTRVLDLQESDSEIADIMMEAAAIAMTWSTKTIILNSDLHLQFFKKLLICLQSPASTYAQREYLYSSGFSCLQASVGALTKSVHQTSTLDVSRTALERSLPLICQDIVVVDEMLSLSACIFLDMLLQTCEERTNPWLTTSIIKMNLLDRILTHYEATIQSSRPSKEVLAALFSIVLRISMTRSGARELSQKSTLLRVMTSKYFRLEGEYWMGSCNLRTLMLMLDGSDDASEALRLLSVFISCAMALGSQLNRKLIASFSQDWQEKLASHARRMAKVKNKDATAFQALLDILKEMTNEIKPA